MVMQRILAARDQRAIMRHARQGARCHQRGIKAKVDMTVCLNQRHPRVRAVRLEKGLRRSDPSRKSRLLCGRKRPPPYNMTTGREGETCAVADQDDFGIAFDDGTSGGIAYCAGRSA